MLVLTPLCVHAGVFSMIFGVNNTNTGVIKEVPDSSSPVDSLVLSAWQNPDTLKARGGGDIFIDEGALVSSGPIGEDEIANYSYSDGEIRVYTVRPGDSLSQIAEMFNVTSNTILWANDISRATAIQPGETLVILPIVGVRHVVKKGDTISTIAKKYEGDVDEILSFNELSSADDIAVGDTLIIPGGAMHSAPTTRYAGASPTKTSGVATGGSYSHPAPGSIRTQGIHGYNAVDLASGHGSAIRAAAAGEVIVSKSSGWNGGYGKYIVVRHSNGAQTLYAHLSANYVGVGAWVSQGETIGAMGSTGRSTGTHLHFEVRGDRNPF
ncbi:M23 family metallopeptidase [Candidatus Kaiserbacteria bacterium]|nr:M23 family metallopeptidase [Candidatus Kaiserbacteria bacterium]